MILPDGIVRPSEFSIFSPDSQLLQDEVRRRLRQPRFTDGRRTSVVRKADALVTRFLRRDV